MKRRKRSSQVIAAAEASSGPDPPPPFSKNLSGHTGAASLPSLFSNRQTASGVSTPGEVAGFQR